MPPETAVNIKSFFDYFSGPVVLAFDKGGKFTDLTFSEYASVTMSANNKSGHHIYFVVNELSGNRRFDDDVVRFRAVFIDDDGNEKGGFTDPDKFPIMPNLAIETSPGKYHYHWLTSTEDRTAWEGVQNTLIDKFNGDPACRNPARIMRVPGYVNVKPQYDRWEAKLTILEEQPYTWAEIEKAFPPTTNVVERDFADKPKFDMVAALGAFLTGENVHESRRSIAMHCVNLGMKEEDIMAVLMSVLNAGVADGSIDEARGKERAGNMKQAITSAVKKRTSELSNIEAIRPAARAEDKFTRLSRPPGSLGVVADDIMGYMQFQSWEMALPVAMHCVSMFGGGIFRMWTTTGCRKREILAGSSRGKSICTRYPKEIMRRLAVGDKHFKHNPYDYGGTAAWTPTAIHADLVEHRVRGYTIAEGGLDKKSKAGSVEEMRKLWLEALTASHKSHLESKQYSMRSDKSLNDKLTDVYGAVVVQLVESVPVHYMEALRGSHAHEGGDTGRTEVVFVPKGRPRRNRSPEDEVGTDVVDMMQLYIRKFEEMNCMGGSDPTNPDKFIKMDVSQVEDAWYDLDDKISDEIDSGNLSDVHEAIMGRYMERLNTTLYVQALADAAYGKKELSVPVVTKEMFEWAVEYQDELNRSLFANLDGGILDDPLERCKNRIAGRMDNFGDYANDKRFAANYRDRIVSKQWVTSVLNKCSEWKQLVDQHHGSLQRAQNELYNALETDGILIPIPTTGKIRQWRLNT